MNSFVALITLSFTLYVCYSWTSMGGGGMSGVTYASGTIYNAGTMCPSNVNQGYVCDGRNYGDKNLNAGTVSSFCGGHPGNSQQYGFGHGVTAAQKCGQCAQIRVSRTDGSYNYMTVMMVDHFTWSMEVGTTEIAYLVQGTRWVVGDRADFDFRIVGDYDCYASFDGGSTPTTTTTPRPTPATVPTPSPPTKPTSSGNSGCGVSSNWGSMKINPYWGSSTSYIYAMIYGAPGTISSFEIRGANQNNNQFQRCIKQNTNAFQCSISGGALVEPASVKLNGGAYYGIDIIQSMTGSSAMYPLSACSKAYGGTFTVEDEAEDNGMNWTVLFAIIICGLVCIGCIVGAIFWWRVKRKRGKAYFAETAGTKHGKHDSDEMIGNDERDTAEMIVEAEVDATEEMIEIEAEIDDDGQEMITATND